jgi:hypothetical protein
LELRRGSLGQPSARHDAGDIQADLNLGRAPTDRHGRAVPFRVDLKNAARQDSQLAALLQGSDLRFDLRSHAVAMNVPPRARVFEEPSARLARHGAPYCLDVRSQTVNDASPISGASHLIARSRAKPMQNRSERRRRRQFRLRDWRDINAAMSLRKNRA